MKKIRIGLAGLGNVGKGVYDIIKKDAALLQLRAGCDFEITAVCARTKKDFLDPKIKFYQNPLDLACDPEIDVVIEVIGGEDIAKDLCEAAIKNNKKLITANKAMLAKHGFELAKLAEQHNCPIAHEASVAGAIPAIKVFKEGLVANEISEFYGILNGTSNFILSKMQSDNLDFADALKQAQDLGYAEADPTSDVKGFDTAHKLTLLASIASATKPAFNQLAIEGIDQITIDDIKLADELGFAIKLLAVYKNIDNKIQMAVYPALIAKNSKLGSTNDSFNAIQSKNSNANWSFILGRGAGSLPTGSAIVADLVDLAKNNINQLFSVKTQFLQNPDLIDLKQRTGRYFIKFEFTNNQEEGFINKLLGDNIKIEKSFFMSRENEVLCGFLTLPIEESEIIKIFTNLDKNLVKAAKFLRIEEVEF